MVIPPILVIDRLFRDAGIPVDGVSVGHPTDRSTWRIEYADAATALQRAQGDALLLTLDPQDPTTVATIKTEAALLLVSQDVLIAVVQAVYEAIPLPSLTPAQVRQRAQTILRNRL